MNPTQGIGLVARLASLFPPESIAELAKASGLVKRSRKFDPMAFLIAVLLGSHSGRLRSIVGLRSRYNQATRRQLCRSSFYARLNRGSATFFRLISQRQLELTTPHWRAMSGDLGQFESVVATDASVLRLHPALAGAYPGTRTNHSPAAAKIHAVINVYGGPSSIRLSSDCSCDGKLLKTGKYLAGQLLIFDLGYYDGQLFDRINRNGGFFLTRLKGGVNPTIIEDLSCGAGQRTPTVGKSFKEVSGRLLRATTDLLVEIEFERRAYLGKASKGQASFRVVGVRHLGEQWFYITNIPAEWLDARAVAVTYRARWQVELAYKALKSYIGLESLPSSKQEVVETLIWASIAAWISASDLRQAAQQADPERARRYTLLRWHAALARHIGGLCSILTDLRDSAHEALRQRIAHWEALFLRDALDPNVSRLPLIEQVEAGLHYGQFPLQTAPT